MFRVSDWVIDKQTGQIGEVLAENWVSVLILLKSNLVYRYPEQLELAPLDIREDDLNDMIELSLITNDREWFLKISERINEERVIEW